MTILIKQIELSNFFDNYSFIRQDFSPMRDLEKLYRKVILKITNLGKLVKAGVEHGAWTSSRGLQAATSKEILKRPKGGRVYVTRTRSGARRRHTASAPGETHANLSGAMRRSLGFTVSATEIEFGYGVTKNNAPEYAEAIEFGRRDGTIKPRPSLQNGIKGERRNFQNNFEREIGERLGQKVTP